MDGNSDQKLSSRKKGAPSVTSKTLSSHTSQKSTKSALGYTPIH